MESFLPPPSASKISSHFLLGGEGGERGLSRSVAGTSQKQEKEETGEEEVLVGEHKLPPTSHSVCQYVCQNGGWDARGNFGVGGGGGTVVAAASAPPDRVCVVAPFSSPPPSTHPPFPSRMRLLQFDYYLSPSSSSQVRSIVPKLGAPFKTSVQNSVW